MSKKEIYRNISCLFIIATILIGIFLFKIAWWQSILITMLAVAIGIISEHGNKRIAKSLGLTPIMIIVLIMSVVLICLLVSFSEITAIGAIILIITGTFSGSKLVRS